MLEFKFAGGRTIRVKEDEVALFRSRDIKPMQVPQGENIRRLLSNIGTVMNLLRQEGLSKTTVVLLSSYK